MSQEHTPKLCECGCGQPAPIARMTNSALGYIRGQPLRFINGHQNRGRHKRTYRSLESRYIESDCGFRTPCWIWQMSFDGRGYGQMWDRVRRTTRRAHRIYYESLIGPIPSGLVIDHLCRVRACVNPAHMEPVPHIVNTRRGSRAKLTDSDRELIFALRADGLTLKAISERVPVHETTVGHVLRLTTLE